VAQRGVKTVFILDDDLEQAELIAAALEDASLIHTRAFTDPIRALAALNEEGGDLLIADISMPWMDGVHVVTSARVKHPELKVILVSGVLDGAEIAHSVGLPFFAKPLDVAALRVATRAALL
jgi:DNA-binding NtrC family response regulator